MRAHVALPYCLLLASAFIAQAETGSNASSPSASSPNAPAAAPAAPPAAKQPPAPGETCKKAPFRAFDFWLGDWEVFGPKGRKLGENTITLTNHGCTLAEFWRGGGGVEGRSYNAYDGLTRQWIQFWSDDQGGTLVLKGGIVDGKMVLEGDNFNRADGKPQRQRITWTPNADGSVRQHWESSDDQGATWQTSFDGTYRLKAKGG